MKNINKIPLLSITLISLASCGTVKPYATHLEDYVRSMNYHDGFNILQLTDIHWNYNTSTMASKNYLDKVLAEVDSYVKGRQQKIDLVELTGDQFMLANAYHVDTFLNYFDAKAEEYGFEYAIIWGNHDNHGLYNPNWLSKKFKRAKHSIYMDRNDDLYGRSNFIINLTTDGSDNTEVLWQIANLDSGASFSETAVSPFRDYDYIREDQVDWFLKEHELAEKQAHENNPKTVPTIAYYHIPQDENETLWQLVNSDAQQKPKNRFFRLEQFADNGNPEYASNFIEEAAKHDLKAAFMGHAHNDDWTVEYEDDDGNKVVLGLGVKTGPELYYAHVDVNSDDPAMKMGLESVGITENFDLIGASLVTLEDTQGNFSLEHLYLNERASGDFVRWVKW